MYKRLLQNKVFLAVASGVSVFLAFAPFHLVPTILLFPFLFNRLAVRCGSCWEAFRYGFLTSFMIMLGGFYWVVYVIHEFGYLPWWAATLLFLGFCGFGSLNFPLYAGVVNWIYRRMGGERWNGRLWVLWAALGFPILFTLCEYIVPKLFPWHLSNCLYFLPLLIQTAEWGGVLWLTFLLFAVGSVAGALGYVPERARDGAFRKYFPLCATVVGLVWAVAIGFGIARLYGTGPQYLSKRVSLVQANIGSLEKVAARAGLGSKVRHVIDRFRSLTDKALKETPASLVLWPETAMPFGLAGTSRAAKEIHEAVRAWNVALISGGYASAPGEDFSQEYNAAFLLEPRGELLHTEIYRKNILLAFGEYMPFGDWFPSLYRMFPAVSNFSRGQEQNSFTLADGTRVGVTICYEAIVPSFYRKVVQPGVQMVVNLTNDSWFGPTSEPYLHGALSVFRAVETRVPLLRVTNTGTSFIVDDRGHISPQTGVYEEGILSQTVLYPKNPARTLYLLWGDAWLLFLVAVQASLLMVTWKTRHASLPL